MSGHGAPTLTTATRPGSKVTIVASSWHDRVMDGLIAGAQRACEEAGADVTVRRVPGSFELPLGAAQAFAGVGGPAADAVVALGVVIRGGTPHFDYVCDAATSGIVRVMLDTAKPIGFGLLTCDNEQQALDRAGLPGAAEDKGYEAAQAALMMLDPAIA